MAGGGKVTYRTETATMQRDLDELRGKFDPKTSKLTLTDHGIGKIIWARAIARSEVGGLGPGPDRTYFFLRTPTFVATSTD